MIQNTNYGASKTYVDTKVDKLTTSGLKAYTHDGATQGEIEVSNTYTPATLALRDSNGRLVAADPASGATDKTLVTANWVSQTGNSSPNNLLHMTGNETVTGSKLFNVTQSWGCTSSDVLTNPTTFVAATLITFVDQLNATTHNSMGSLTRVRNNANQNYLDLTSTSYGFYENGVQMKMDIFMRLLVNESDGSASIIFYRSKRRADGTGTADTKAKVLGIITAGGTIS